MSIVATGDVEVGKSYEMVETRDSDKPSPDMTWVNVNFKAGNKSILSSCWGNVSTFDDFDWSSDNWLSGTSWKSCCHHGPEWRRQVITSQRSCWTIFTFGWNHN